CRGGVVLGRPRRRASARCERAGTRPGSRAEAWRNHRRGSRLTNRVDHRHLRDERRGDRRPRGSAAHRAGHRHWADRLGHPSHWWRLRPHPRLGTVEVRALDVHSRLEQTGALVALIHALARHEAEGERSPSASAEILEEASYRARREGTAAELPDAEGYPRP